MALKQITRVAKEQDIKQYEGVGTFTIKAVNPTAADIEKLFGYAPEKEPEYITKDASTGKVTDIRLSFYGVLENTDGSVSVNHNFSIFLKRQPRENDPSQRDIKGHKYMFIDRFGNTSWETKDHQKQLGRKFDYDNCHIAFEGEDILANLMIAMNPDIRTNIWDYDETNKFTLKSGDLTDAENYLEENDIKNIWNGNLKDLLSVLRSACTVGTKIKLAVGHKEGSVYPVTYTRSFVSCKASNTQRAINQYTKKINENCSSKETYPMTDLRLVSEEVETAEPETSSSVDALGIERTSSAFNNDDSMPF